MKKRPVRILLLTLVLLIVSFASLLRFAYAVPSAGAEERLSSVYAFAARGEIVEATLLDENSLIVGKRCTTPLVAPGQCSGTTVEFHASYPRSDVATQRLIDVIASPSPPAVGAPVDVAKQTSKAVAKLLVTFVFPLLLLVNLFALIFLSRSSESSIVDIVSFGRIGRKRQRDRHKTDVTFADIAGVEDMVTELSEVTDYLKDPKKFEAYGAAVPKGVLLFGQPGCGKTLLARAVAGESGVPFFSTSGAEFVESLVGVGAARVRDLFRQVAEVAPAIVFIDEIDAVGRRRSGEGFSGGEREQTLNQLLVEMDGFEVSAGVVVMAATNRPDILDPALLRPGRFDRHITLEPPDFNGRKSILALHAKGKRIAEDVDFDLLARRTPGFTGADLANVINEAALLAIRQGKGDRIQEAHLTEAVQRVLHGPQRRGRIMTAEERKRIALHEAGHAIVTAALGHGSEVQRVSIVARGRGLGQSIVSGESERVLFTRGEMESQLAIAMAGTAAEEAFCGESSTTSGDDINRATALAREMVGRYGMSEMGRIRMLGRDDAYLSGDGAAVEPVSGRIMQEFDEQVMRLIATAETRAMELLIGHRPLVERMVEALEEQETLDGEPLAHILAAALEAQVVTKPEERSPSTVAGNGPEAKPKRPRRA